MAKKGGSGAVPTVSPSSWSMEEWAYAVRNPDVGEELQTGASNFGRPSGHYSSYGRGEGREWGVSERDYKALYQYRANMNSSDRATLENWYRGQHQTQAQVVRLPATQAQPTVAAAPVKTPAQLEQERIAARDARLRPKAETNIDNRLISDARTARVMGSIYSPASKGSAPYLAAVENEFKRLVMLDENGGKDPAAEAAAAGTRQRRAAANASGNAATILTGDVALDDDFTLSKQSLLGR